MFSLPPIEPLTSVTAALAWLLDVDRAISPSEVLREAHERGVIDAMAGSHWKADGPALAKLVRAALRRAPLPSEELGKVLHGVGELSARSHARLRISVQAFLKAHRRSINLVAVLDAAAALDDTFRRSPTLEGIASSQWIAKAQINWVDYQNAFHRVRHPWIDGSGVFGFSFVVRCVLRIDLHTIDQWVAAHPDAPALATVGNVLAKNAMRTGALRPLVKSGVPAFRLLAAAVIVSPVFEPRDPITVRGVLDALEHGKFDAGDAIWIAGSLIKEAIHSRYRLEGGCKETTARRDYLEQHPEGALGAAQNAEGEKRSLEQRLAYLNGQYETLLPALEHMLVELADNWPKTGLSESQLAQLENIFVDTAEMRFRLAEKVAHKGNRDWLLRQNLARLKSYLGLARPGQAFTETLHATENFATETAPWVARSSVRLFEDDARGVGRRISNLLNPLTVEAERLLAQPFFTARAPALAQSAAMRAAGAYFFALMVTAAIPEARRGEVEKLNEMAIEHSCTLLSSPVSCQLDPRLFDRLAASAVYQMGFFASGIESRRQWALRGELPDFPRSLALWSSPLLLDEYPELGARLFKSVGALPLSHGALNRQISNALSLLDVAIAACAADGRHDLIEQVVSLWAGIYSDWLPISSQWASAASEFAAAIENEGPERVKMLTHPTLASTHCRALIVARNADTNQVTADRDI